MTKGFYQIGSQKDRLKIGTGRIEYCDQGLIHMKAKTFALILSMTMVHYALASSSDTAEAQCPDIVISKNFISQYKSGTGMNGSSISVRTFQGVASLYGNVNSETEANRSVEIAAAIPGVKDVDATHLKVNESSYPMKDDYLAAKIKGMFMQKRIILNHSASSSDISVEADNGVILLSGKAANLQQVKHAIEIAKSVSGVKQVRSRIEIKSVPR